MTDNRHPQDRPDRRQDADPLSATRTRFDQVALNELRRRDVELPAEILFD